MIVDIEKVVSGYLRADADITGLVADRVVGATPRSTGDAWVRLTLLDAPSSATAPVEHLIAYLLQVDCYASTTGLNGSQQKEANLLARTVRAALHVMPSQTFSDAIISAVRFTGMIRLPDQAFEETRERVILTAQIYAHPLA